MSKPEKNFIKVEDLLTRDGKSNVLFLNYDNEALLVPLHFFVLT